MFETFDFNLKLSKEVLNNLESHPKTSSHDEGTQTDLYSQ